MSKLPEVGDYVRRSHVWGYSCGVVVADYPYYPDRAARMVRWMNGNVSPYCTDALAVITEEEALMYVLGGED